MKSRVITGFVYTFLILAGIFIGGWAMLALLGFAMVVSVNEVYRAIRNTGIEPVRWAGYLFCALTIVAQGISLVRKTELNLPMIAIVISVSAALIRLVSHGKIAVDSMMATVFPIIYPGVFFVAIMNLTSLGSRACFTAAMVLTFFSAAICDVFALLGGMFFGKHKLSPVLSPKKTIEGSISGLLFCILFSLAIPLLLRIFLFWDRSFAATIETLPPLWAFAILGAICGVVCQVGDLTASMVKRHCQIKDFGTILPGHGGLMDRLDGSLFCGVACYIFFEIMKLV